MTVTPIIVDLQGMRGDSEYDLWLAAGNSGTLQDFFADRVAAAAAAVALQFPPTPRRLGFIGDSIMARNHGAASDGSAMYTRGDGEVAWAQAFHPYFEIDTWVDLNDPRDFIGMNSGVSGDTAAQTLARVADASLLAPDIQLVSVGTNSLNAGVSAADTFSDIQSICEHFRSYGIRVVLSTVRPRSDWPDGDARLAALLALNVLIRGYCAAGNATLWDAHAVYDDGTNRPIPGVLVDGLHLTRTGAALGGADLANVMRRLAPPTIAAKPFGSNVFSGGLFVSSGGVAGTGMTGTVGAGWAVNRASGSHTGVCSLIPDGGQRVVITPNAGLSSEILTVSRAFGAPAVTAGRWYQGYAKVALSQWDGWRAVVMQADLAKWIALEDTGAATATIPAAEDGPVQLTLITPPFIAADGDVAPLFRCYIDGTASGTGTLDILEIGCAQVPDPRPRHNL